MKFPIPVPCQQCGTDFSALGYGELTFPPALCPNCGQTIHIIDPLTMSIVAVRLLFRGQAELDHGDFTMPIICAAMAIESALTSLFLKWKKIESGLPAPSITDAQREQWEKDYRDGVRPGGFPSSANFVCSHLTGKSYDDFVSDFVQRSSATAIAGAGLPATESEMKADYIKRELFWRRNRVMHWGEVNHSKSDAETALTAGRTAFAALTLIDKHKADKLDKRIRASMTGTP